MIRSQFHFTAPWVEVLAVDGIRLPAKVNLKPDLAPGLQRISYCMEEPTKKFEIIVDGAWYQARPVTCATNL